MRRKKFGKGSSERYVRWLAALDTHDVRFLILDARRDRALLEAVRADPAWTFDSGDADTLLFARTEQRPAPLAA
ncbi:MAG: hypothetical protein PVG11_00180 [Anaerolineae bacterium]|jgi:hypothetical protein